MKIRVTTDTASADFDSTDAAVAALKFAGSPSCRVAVLASDYDYPSAIIEAVGALMCEGIGGYGLSPVVDASLRVYAGDYAPRYGFPGCDGDKTVAEDERRVLVHNRFRDALDALRDGLDHPVPADAS